MSGAAAEVVSTITGMLRRAGSSLISASTCRPSFLGRLRSSRTGSGTGAAANRPCRWKNSIASSPSIATWRSLGISASRSTSVVRSTSSGSSSTRRIWILLTGHHRETSVRCGSVKAKIEPPLGAGSCQISPPSRSTILLDCETHSGSRVLGAVQALEHPKGCLDVPYLDSDSVVSHREPPADAEFAGGDLDPGVAAKFADFRGVTDQIRARRCRRTPRARDSTVRARACARRAHLAGGPPPRCRRSPGARERDPLARPAARASNAGTCWRPGGAARAAAESDRERPTNREVMA